MKIKEIETYTDTVELLLTALEEQLFKITGDSGSSSFQPKEIQAEKTIFVVGYEGEKAVACGAIRQYKKHTAELKRMYSHVPKKGYGKQILQYLEQKASEAGYKTIILSTRKVNVGAVAFYQKSGYQRIANFGRYEGKSESICFQKEI